MHTGRKCIFNAVKNICQSAWKRRNVRFEVMAMIFLEKRSYLVMPFSISVCVYVWVCGLLNLAKSLIHTHASLALSRLSVSVCDL